jgi:hypothetical protein
MDLSTTRPRNLSHHSGSVSASDPFGIHAEQNLSDEMALRSRLTIVHILPEEIQDHHDHGHPRTVQPRRLSFAPSSFAHEPQLPAQPRHCTHNARLLPPGNYAILRSHPPRHPTLTSLSLLKYLHHLGALSTPITHILFRRLPRTSFHCLTANFYLSSIVPRRFRTLSILVQRTD